MTLIGPFKAVKISEHVYWVGAIDWGIRNFHGYETSRGTTYNAYLVMADKVTLIDTVKAPFADEMLSRVASVIEPSRIDYIISNHAEMDHTGALPRVIDVVHPEKVFASVMGVKAIERHFDLDTEITPLKNEESLSLGNMNLSFIHTPMLHWPDSMVSYLAEEEILFSQDAFGMHLATTERFDDEIEREILEEEAGKYYANILLPFSQLVSRLLGGLPALNLRIKLVAPDHGPIWRSCFDRILKWYTTWAAQKPTKKAVIIYATMWNSTNLMARAISDGLTEGGVAVKIMPLDSSHRSDIATAVMNAGAVLIGSPTINNNIFPSVMDVLTYLKGLKPKNLTGAAFGSFGWSGEAVGLLNESLKSIGVDLVSDGVKANYVPDLAALEECVLLGKAVAERLKEKCG
ncbi:MAG: flavodoxin domain-containing protein [Candidatus Coatesbacteria bacterium]|nr:flavodoxin domain-containing protein [Candidatus Coatesbacteria bacterium]